LHNLPKYSVPKGKVPDHLTQLQNISKTIPGTGKYNPIRKTKILGNYFYKTPIGAFTDDAMSRAYDTPGPYNLIDTERYKMPRTPFVKIIKENGSGEKGEKEKSPSPGQYETHKAFLRTSTIENSIQWSIPKAEKLMFTDYSIKAAKYKPSVGNYELAKSDGRVTIGARGKPGYYK